MTDVATTKTAILSALQGRLIVSCQPVAGGPMDRTDIIIAFAQAALIGGAAGLRIEGAENVAAVRNTTQVPLIGLIKRDLPEGQRITPSVEDVQTLILAGADIIAIDATRRPRQCSLPSLVQTIHQAGRLVMADCSDVGDAVEAHSVGADILGTTLSGYTGGPVPVQPDLAMIKALQGLGAPILAEGRYNAPSDAADAITAGAWAVVVGSAITRAEHVTGWFAEAVAGAARNVP